MKSTSAGKSELYEESPIAFVPPPSALPSFMTQQIPVDSVSNSEVPLVVPLIMTTSETSSKDTYVKVDFESSGSQHHVEVSCPSQPITNQPLPPSSSSCSTDLRDSDSVALDTRNDWFDWLKDTVQTVGSKVAEKAKNSMDTMITTLDPQMKDFINSGGDIDIIVASDKEVKVSAVKEAFQKLFGKATVSGFASQADGIAAQPVGFEAAVKSAEGRINFVRNSGKIHPQQTVVAIESFIVEFMPHLWYEMSLLLLDDPWHDIILQTYTQTTPVPLEFVQEARTLTGDEYEFKSSGFSTTIGHVASGKLHVAHTAWQENLTGILRRESILLAARSLAGLYQSRLPKDVI